MAAKVIAQMIISGTTIMTKAFFSAYQQALRSKNVFFFYLLVLFTFDHRLMHCYSIPLRVDAKVGGAPGAATTAAPTKFKIRPDEALKILNIEKDGLTKTVLDEVSRQLLSAIRVTLAERPVSRCYCDCLR